MTRAVVYLHALLDLMQHGFEGRKERGATAVEYGVLVGLITFVLIVAITAIGERLNAMFQAIVGGL